MIIRKVKASDFMQIQKIYAYYVENTTISLEETAPSVEELKSRRKAGMPYLVAEVDGKVAGYAYAFEYRPRCAYRFTVEESVYISKDHQGQGIGQKLLMVLIDECRAKGFKQMLAVVAGADNVASIKFHERMGFKKAGVLKNFGYKFDTWIDTTLLQRTL